MSTVVVEKARLEHVMLIAPRLREADRNEIAASCKMSSVEAMASSYRNSTHAWTAFIDGKPSILFGVAPLSILGGVGSPWLLATDDIAKIRRQFVRQSRGYVKEMLKVYPELVNFVDTRNDVSIRWLKWLGFRFDDPIVYGVNGEMFYPFRKVA